MPPKWKLEIRKPEASQANLNNLAMPPTRLKFSLNIVIRQLHNTDTLQRCIDQ